MENYDCEVCGKSCDRDKGEVEICTECGQKVCKDHLVVGDEGLPYCLDCGLLEAQRQMIADAPGVWPDWARGLKPRAIRAAHDARAKRAPAARREETTMKFTLKDVMGPDNAPLKGEVVVEGGDRGIAIRIEGYGDLGSAEGHGTPILLERHEGRLRLVIWDDINQEEPTAIIGLEGARESKRKPE
jgi:hypothetical protein